MIYRPNFCSYCGEKIERATWPLLSSRRFCDLCQTDHQAVDWVPRIVVIVGLVLGAAGMAALYRPPKPLESVSPGPSVELKARAPANSAANQINATPSAITQSQTGPVLTETERTQTPPPVTLKGAAASSGTNAVYYCGAATKKGTPCTRRVKRPGERCWQHQGMPPMTESAQK